MSNGPIQLDGRSLSARIMELEIELIRQAMEKSGYCQVKAAKLLQISRGALQHKLKKYRIGKPSPQEETQAVTLMAA